jgi:hypothetical protein
MKRQDLFNKISYKIVSFLQMKFEKRCKQCFISHRKRNQSKCNLWFLLNSKIEFLLRQRQKELK